MSEPGSLTVLMVPVALCWRVGHPVATLTNHRPNKPQPEALTAEERAELKRLRKEVAVLKMERDILKKATAYFAKGSLPDASGS